eukprot:4064630-Pyramimonas_sp.AAC.1
MPANARNKFDRHRNRGASLQLAAPSVGVDPTRISSATRSSRNPVDRQRVCFSAQQDKADFGTSIPRVFTNEVVHAGEENV